MAITLRYTSTDTGGKTSELSYQEMNDNLKSYYYSSSLDGTTLVLHTTGSDTHSIDLSAFVDDTNTNIANTNLTLDGNRTLTLDGFGLTFDALQGENTTFSLENGATFKIQLNNDSRFYLENLQTSARSGSYYLGYNTSNGEVTYHETSSITGPFFYSASVDLNTITFYKLGGTTGSVTVDTGSGGLPGGSNTQIQFNDGGIFGGDDGFTYNKTTNTVTIISAGSGSDAITTYPALILSSSDTSIADGDVIGLLAASNTALGGGNYNAAIAFKADGAWGGGGYHSKIELQTVQNAVESTKVAIHRDGEVRFNKYGSGSFAGTGEYYLTVSGSGEILETPAPVAPNITRTSAITHSFNGDVGNSADYSWAIEIGSGTSAPNSGSMRVGHSSPGSKLATSITAISFHRTSANSNITSEVLDYLCENGTIAFRTTGGAVVSDTIKIKEVDNSNDSYVIVYVDASLSSNSVDTSTTYYMDFQTDALITLQDQNYNRVVLNNLASSSPAVVLVPPSTAVSGDYYLVEISAGSTNSGAFALNYGKYITGTGSTYDIARTAVRYLAGTNTVTAITLDYSSYGQAAILHLRVHEVGGAQPSFALIGADLVLS